MSKLMNRSEHKLDMINIGQAEAIVAKQYYSGFALAHDTYNALSLASDGRIYYVLSSQSIDQGGQMYCFDPKTETTKHLADLTEVCGEREDKYIPQGKSHVEFYERQGKLFFSTHVGVYEMIEGMERLPETPPPGYQLYRGGHILSYDLTTGELKDLALVPGGEGVLTMVMDEQRGHIYGITWPTGYFFHYDVDKNEWNDLGPVATRGEAGIPGKDYRVLCRSMFVDPKEGKVYYSNSGGDIFSYHPETKRIELLPNVDLRLDYLGQYDMKSPGSMGYNWRKIFWHPTEDVAYGVHGNSGYLFRFDSRQQHIEIVERITSAPSKRSGMFDQFSYGYLGFQLGPDKETIYYLTGGPIYVDGQRLNGEAKIAKGAARGLENLHLVTWHLPTRRYRDHGPVFYADGSRPTYVNSIAVGADGADVYTLARFINNGTEIQDLVRIPVSA